MEPQDLATTLVQKLRRRLGSRVWDLCVEIQNDVLIIQGKSNTYHAKQLAQHMAMEESDFQITNEIVVVG